MKKKISVIGIMFLLMISIASASVLDYYGKIEGSANVKGPTFYASPDGTLLINKESSTFDTYNVTDGNAIVFWTTESLGGIDFNYIPKADLYVTVGVNNATPSKPLELIFGYSNTSGLMNPICSSIVNVNDTEVSNYHVICNGTSTLSGVNKFYYKMQGGADTSIEYSIDTNGTKIEVDKA
jgi:hypothetical protein